MKTVLRRVAIGATIVFAAISIAAAPAVAHADTGWGYVIHVFLTR
ncbi:hypothetical protein [Nocardioides montaniterrae]